MKPVNPEKDDKPPTSNKANEEENSFGLGLFNQNSGKKETL